MPIDNAICPRCKRDLTDAVRLLGREALALHLWSHERQDEHRLLDELVKIMFGQPDGKIDFNKDTTATEMAMARELVKKYWSMIHGRHTGSADQGGVDASPQKQA